MGKYHSAENVPDNGKLESLYATHNSYLAGDTDISNLDMSMFYRTCKACNALYSDPSNTLNTNYLAKLSNLLLHPNNILDASILDISTIVSNCFDSDQILFTDAESYKKFLADIALNLNILSLYHYDCFFTEKFQKNSSFSPVAVKETFSLQHSSQLENIRNEKEIEYIVSTILNSSKETKKLIKFLNKDSLKNILLIPDGPIEPIDYLNNLLLNPSPSFFISHLDKKSRNKSSLLKLELCNLYLGSSVLLNNLDKKTILLALEDTDLSSFNSLSDLFKHLYITASSIKALDTYTDYELHVWSQGESNLGAMSLDSPTRVAQLSNYFSAKESTIFKAIYTEIKTFKDSREFVPNDAEKLSLFENLHKRYKPYFLNKYSYGKGDKKGYLYHPDLVGKSFYSLFSLEALRVYIP